MSTRSDRFWIGFILIPPILAVVGGIATLMIAIKMPDPQIVEYGQSTGQTGPGISATGRAAWVGEAQER